MIRLSDILEEISTYRPDADLEFVKRAYVYSAKVHQGQVRKSGEPYLIHPLEVAHILAQLKLDEASIVAGILHDTIEDTLATKEEIAQLFGSEVAEIVDGVTKLGQYATPLGRPKEERDELKQAENFRKMLVAMSRDIRVIIVKLADRLHNMRTLDAMRPEKQQRIAQETLDIYAPIANRLGISWVKVELEDLCFKYLRPEDFNQLQIELQKTHKERERYIAGVVKKLEIQLKAAGITAQVSGRPKHLWSIYRKMKRKGIGLESIHDLIAFRIVVPSIADCYQALGMVHGSYRPVPGRFKDFIAIPKPNNYQSLHTTVSGPGGDRIEIQIRTDEMHGVAEQGIAAHWAYKEGKKGSSFSSDEQKFAWLRQLVEWQKELKDPREFLDSVKVDLFSDEVFVFTPRGEVRPLPRGSTPVDFAYAIHSQVGDKCVGAKVNGRIVPLRYTLKDGDIIEVLTSNSTHPTKDWLTFVKTSKAQTRIRAWIRQTQRVKSLELGKELCEREFKRYGLTFNRLVREEKLLLEAASHFGYRSIDDVVAAVGIGKVAPSQLIARVAPEKFESAKNADSTGKEADAIGPGQRLTDIFKKVMTVGTSKGRGGVRIGGVDDVLVRFGKCCHPVPGDVIGGYITRGRGVSVHARDCPRLLAMEPERRIDVTWDVKSDFVRPISLRVTSEDRAGLLARMTEVFGHKGISIIQANAKAVSEERAISTFEVGIRDLTQLKDVMRALEQIKGVHLVDRL